MKKSMFIIVLFLVLVVVAICAILIAFLSGNGSDGDANGMGLGLYIKWDAEQADNENFAYVTANVYIKYSIIEVGELTSNTVSINSEKRTFATSAISYDSGIIREKLIATHTVKVARKPGETVNCPIEAEWMFNGIADGERVKKLTASVNALLNDESIAETEPVGTGTDGPSETTDIPGDTTKAPETTKVPETTKAPETTDIPNDVEMPEITEDGTLRWELGDENKDYIRLRAECYGTPKENGTVDLTVFLFLDYHTIFMGDRRNCKLTANGKTVTFEIPSINESENIAHSQYIATLELTGIDSDTVGISASVPFGGIYDGVKKDYITLSGTIGLKR